MVEILIGKIQRPFLAQFLTASLLGVSAATRADSFVGWIRNDYSLGGEYNISQNGRSCMERFEWYHPVTHSSWCMISRPADMMRKPDSKAWVMRGLDLMKLDSIDSNTSL
jgi:hypothetical protein